MLKKLTVLLIAGLLTLGCNAVNRLITPATPTSAPPPPGLTEADYTVYAALIEAMYPPNRAGVMVITAETTLGLSGDSPEQLQFLTEAMPEVDQALRDTFLTRNAQPDTLTDRFNFSIPVVLLPQDELSQLFGKNGGGWNEFYQTYPEAQGLLSLSKAGFNASGDKALVYIGEQAGPLAGVGYAVVLTLQDGKWTILNQVMLWIS